MAAAESYPDDLKYHRGARLGPHRGRRGRARDHVVRAGLARRARPLRGARDGRGRLEGRSRTARSSRSRPSPTSSRRSPARCSRSTRRSSTRPETVNEDPYGNGWLIRIRSPIRPRSTRCSTLPAYKPGPRGPVTQHPFLALTDDDREEMLATIGVSSVEELFRDIPAGVRFDRELDLEPAALRAGALRAPRRARVAQRRRDARALVPRRGDLRPLRARRSSTR